MTSLRKLALATATASILMASPLVALADDKDLSQQLSEARQEGSIWTAIALNRHLNPFKIDVDVESGTAILSGIVENDIDRDLAEQIALGIEGISEVDNQLQVDGDATRSYETQSDLAQRFEDATTTATVKSKLLWNRHTEGLNIGVETRVGVVTLTGTAQSAAAKDLAGRLARNTDGVRSVENDIQVDGEKTLSAKAQDTARDVGDEVSDAWITSKVKSSFLLNPNLKGMDIRVQTRSGDVTLSGVVNSGAEKDLAEEIAKNIRGVGKVDISGLQVQD